MVISVISFNTVWKLVLWITLLLVSRDNIVSLASLASDFGVSGVVDIAETVWNSIVIIDVVQSLLRTDQFIVIGSVIDFTLNISVDWIIGKSTSSYLR